MALKKFRTFFVGAWIFSFFINILVLVPSIYMLQIYDRVLASRNVTTLIVMTFVVAVLLLEGSLLETFRSRVLVRIGGGFDRNMGPRLFRATFKAALQRPGMGSSQVLRDLDTVREFGTGSGIFALFDAPWLPVYLGIVFLVHWVLGLVSVVGAVAICALAILQEVSTRRTLKDSSVASINAARLLDNSLRNAEVITAMGMVPAMQERWQERRQKTLTLQALASDRAGLITALSRFVRLLLQSSILGFGAYLVIQNELTAGLMIAASIMMGRALAPIELAVGSWRQLLAARDSWERLNNLLVAIPGDTEHMPLPPPIGQLELERVVAAPPGSNVPVVKGVGLRVGAGDALGIIGPSAAGKSSLARLMVGVWPAHSGVVRIDGADIQTWDRDRLGPFIGYLPQDIELFEGSIAENIARFGDIDSDDVIAAARMAGVHDMILQMPNGYDTVIGAGGMSLSGGQRQRIGLARALYKTPKLVVLDEPNSNLDRDGEAALSRALGELKARKCTTIVVTHRPSILAHVDYIMVMANGLAESFGPRDDMLAKYLKPNASASPPSPAGAGALTTV